VHVQASSVERNAAAASEQNEEICVGDFCTPQTLVSINNCLELSKHGFPLETDVILQTNGNTKRGYFDYLKAFGYDTNLHVVAKGDRQIILPVSLISSGVERVLFIGDCMQRQASQSFASESQGLVPSTEIGWMCDGTDRLISMVSDELRQNGADHLGNGVVLWMGCGIWALTGGDINWVAKREDMLRTTVSKVRDAFPGAKLIWDTPSSLNMAVLSAPPAKPDLWKFVDRNISRLTGTFAAIDRAVLRELKVPVVPRSAISASYSGLQCDGIHNVPKSAGVSEGDTWGCPSYPAAESLVLQAGLAALLGGDADTVVCRPS